MNSRTLKDQGSSRVSVSKRLQEQWAVAAFPVSLLERGRRCSGFFRNAIAERRYRRLLFIRRLGKGSFVRPCCILAFGDKKVPGQHEEHLKRERITSQMQTRNSLKLNDYAHRGEGQSITEHYPEEFGGKGLFNGPTTTLASSMPLHWNGLAVEETLLEPCEMPESVSDRHLLAMWCTCGTGEHSTPRAGFRPFTKPAGVLTFVGPGLIPAARTTGVNRLLCASIDTLFMVALAEEQDRRPKTSFHERTGFNDASISHLLELLILETRTGGESGVLYADQLAHALGTRILMFCEEGPTKHITASPGLPKTVLRRVLDLFDSSDEDLNLAVLAQESGYSRRHFLRMFRQSVGMTPHRYVMETRLRRAQKLMKDKSLSLLDIALCCGFASHSHMTRVFREQRGLTPSELRRNI